MRKRTDSGHELHGHELQEEDCKRFEAHVSHFTGSALSDSSCSISYISPRREAETGWRCECWCTFGGTLPDPPALQVHVALQSLDAAPGSAGKREPLGNSPLSFSLQPGPMCVFASEAAGPGLSLATAGIIHKC